jgi:hypothetical protein
VVKFQEEWETTYLTHPCRTWLFFSQSQWSIPQRHGGFCERKRSLAPKEKMKYKKSGAP